MKKRILITVLLLCFIFSGIFSLGAFADNVKHMHPRTSFHLPFSSPLPVGEEDSFYLTSDFKAETDILIDREVDLCLNGFTMDMGSFSILIGEKGSLTVNDCPESTGGCIRSTAGSENAMIQNSGTFFLNSGVLYTENRTALFNRAEAAIQGGFIRGENTDLVKTIGSSLFSVNGGEIQVKGSGSAVRMVADPADDSAKKRDYNVGIGGAALVSATDGCEATLVVDAPKGRFVLNGGSTKGLGCPAVSVISGNFDVYGASAIYSDRESAIVGTGGNVSLYNAIIVSDEKYGVDVSADANLLLSGSLDINGGMASVHMAEGKLFSMSDYGFYGNVILSIHTDTDPTEGSPVAVSTPCDKKHVPHFISSNPGCSITYENGVIYNTYDGSVSHFHEGRNYVLPLDPGLGDLTKNNYYLQSDMSRSGFFTGNMVNLCLNGHTLKLSSAIKMYPGSTLNIFDCVGGGKIESNSNVIQDINDGDVKIILHDGVLISHGSSVVRLGGNDSLVVNDGSIQNEFEGSSAVEVSGPGNSLAVNGGEIIGVHTGVKLQDAELNLSGDAGSIKGNVYAIDNTGYKQGKLFLEGSPALSGETADIHLAANMLLIPQNGFSPADTVSLAVDAIGDFISLCDSTDGSYGKFFQPVDGERKLISGLNNSLVLAKPLVISPETAELIPGSSADFAVEYTGSSTQPVYQWYLRDLQSMIVSPIDGAAEASCTVLADFPSGNYELFCMVSDEAAQYISAAATLSVAKDEIESVSVRTEGNIAYTESEITPAVEASASTKLGKAVSFSYSADGVSYDAAVPAIGPEAGEYIIYYTASAEGCEDVQGQFTVRIDAPEENEVAEAEDNDRKFNVDIRFIAIMGLVVIELIVCTIYLIMKVKKD